MGGPGGICQLQHDQSCLSFAGQAKLSRPDGITGFTFFKIRDFFFFLREGLGGLCLCWQHLFVHRQASSAFSSKNYLAK